MYNLIGRLAMQEDIIDKDFTQSYWVALQFWVQSNRIFTVGVPQASHGIMNKSGLEYNPTQIFDL